MTLPHRWFAALLLTLMALLFTQTLSAQDLSVQAPSLKLVPGDAQVYSVSLHAREQFEAIFKSRAWAKLNSLPIAKMAWEKFAEEWKREGGELEKLRTWYEQPENRELVELLIDMMGHEVFYYGGPNSAEFIQLIQELQNANQFAPLMELATGQKAVKDVQDPELQMQAVLQRLAKNPNLLTLPEQVVGFRLENPKAARAQFKRLEPLVALAAELEPKVKDALKKAKIAGGEFYVLTLEGKMLPWDMIPIQKYEANPGDFDDLVKKIKSMNLTMTLGLRDNYVLFSMGQSTKLLESLGKKPFLTERPELKPLAKFADKKLSGISYLSKDWQDKINSVDLVGEAEEWMKSLKESPLPEARQKKLQAEIKSWAAELQKMMPVPGAHLTFSFLTDTGEEIYQYDWTKNHGLDSSKPLTILQHAGGAPLLAVAARSKYAPQDYQTLVKICNGAIQAFEEYGLPQLEEEAQQQYKKVSVKVMPLLKRLDTVTGEMLIPALADGQGGFVLDNKLTSKQWHNSVPPTKKPLPILEPAILIGVSDAELLRKACQEYWDITHDVIALMGEFSPEAKEFKLPAPQTKKDKNGTIYFYPLPKEAGLDPKLVPTAGLGEKVAVLTISNQHASRLLASTTFKSKKDLKLDTTRPAAVAVYFDWPALVDTALPWVELAIETAGTGTDDVISQVRTVAEILKVLRGAVSVSYEEGDAVVTHTRSVFEDIAP